METPILWPLASAVSVNLVEHIQNVQVYNSCFTNLLQKCWPIIFLNINEYLNFISFHLIEARCFIAVFTLRIPYSLTPHSTPICQHIAPLWSMEELH